MARSAVLMDPGISRSEASDLRFESRRIIPRMGNSSSRTESIWGLGMAAVIDRHLARAAFLRGMFLEALGDVGILGARARDFEPGIQPAN